MWILASKFSEVTYVWCSSVPLFEGFLTIQRFWRASISYIVGSIYSLFPKTKVTLHSAEECEVRSIFYEFHSQSKAFLSVFTSVLKFLKALSFRSIIRISPCCSQASVFPPREVYICLIINYCKTYNATRYAGSSCLRAVNVHGAMLRNFVFTRHPSPYIYISAALSPFAQ